MASTELAKAVAADLGRLRERSPLVHNITNYVVMNSTANALLCVGASPVMAHAIEEVEEMVGIAGALVLNIGTLSGPWIEAMVRAGRAARQRGIPVVLDPVGAGATRLRTATAERLLAEAAPTVVRGNASEIRALVQADPAARSTRGVDSAHRAEEALDAARALAERCRCVVSVSGETDVIVGAGAGAGEVLRVRNGHPWMPRVTGMGCAASALTGAFAAVAASPLQAAADAMVVNGLAGELAADRAQGPGSFQVAFLDALFQLDADTVARRARIERG